MRKMIDCTHSELPSSIDVVKTAQLVAGYVTGSPDIRWTAADWASIPKGIIHVTIDQGAAGSPVLDALVRDCETGAWQVPEAANKHGWNVPRPTLYLGYPDTVAEAYGAGWRGDVWIADPNSPLGSPAPPAPAGINIVAAQREYSGTWDRSDVFDPTWPGVKMSTPNVLAQEGWAWCRKCQGLFYEVYVDGSVCPAGGKHDGTQSGNYVLTDIKPTGPGQ